MYYQACHVDVDVSQVWGEPVVGLCSFWERPQPPPCIFIAIISSTSYTISSAMLISSRVS